MTEEDYILIIGIIVIILLIAYGIFLWYSYRNKTFIFDYTPPQLKNGYQPAGQVKTLSENDVQERKNGVTTSNLTSNNHCSGGTNV